MQEKYLKRIRTACFILAGFLVFNGFSKSKDIDSLKSVYAKSQSDSVKLVALNQLAQAYQNTDTILYYAHKLLEEATNQPLIWTYRAYQKIGQTYRYKGDLNRSIEYLFKALEISNELEPVKKAMIYINLGDVYSLAGDFSRSYEYYRKAINLFSGSNSRSDSIYLMITYNNFGDKFLSKEVYDSAMKYFLAAKPIAKKLNREYNLAILNGNIALVNAGLGKDGSAEKEINEAVEYLLSIKDFYSVSIYLTYMADIYLKRNNLDQAIYYAKKALDYATMEDLKEQIRDASQKLAKLYEIKKDFRSAFVYQEKYFIYNDSINNVETVKKMADLRTEYEVGQKQAEVDLLTVEKQNQRIILFAVAGFALILVILALVIYRFYQSKARINQVLETQKEKLESLNETKDKFFSIISHDLRGPVSSFMGISRMIKHFVNTKDTNQLLEVADDIDNSVRRLSTLLDNLLTWAMQQQGSFPYVPEKLNFNEMAEELVQTLDTMASAKNIRLFAEFDGPVILWADKNTTMTIIRNLVSNSLKFTPDNGEVKITAKQQGEYAEISISDTGVGIPKEKLEALFKLQAKKSTFGTSGEKGLGLGLQLVNEFIDMNGGRIKVDSKEGEGSTFTVWLPLFEAEKVEAVVGKR